MTTTIDLSGFPEEIANYVLDQLSDRLQGREIDEATRAVVVGEAVGASYDPPKVVCRQTIVEQIVTDALEEKINDVEHEILGGERDDYSVEDIREWRSLSESLDRHPDEDTVEINADTLAFLVERAQLEHRTSSKDIGASSEFLEEYDEVLDEARRCLENGRV
jgi:hypothetical protein